MEKTFEFNRRCTLTHLSDYIDAEKPARFTEGALRDIHCEILAWESIRFQKENDRRDHVLVLLDRNHNCIGYRHFDANIREEDKQENPQYYRDAILGDSSTAEIAEHAIASKAHSVIIVYGNTAENKHIYPSNPISGDRGFISRVAVLFDLININFIECRSVQLDRSYETRKD